jgi:hypothetical protein
LLIALKCLGGNKSLGGKLLVNLHNKNNITRYVIDGSLNTKNINTIKLYENVKKFDLHTTSLRKNEQKIVSHVISLSKDDAFKSIDLSIIPILIKKTNIIRIAMGLKEDQESKDMLDLLYMADYLVDSRELNNVFLLDKMSTHYTYFNGSIYWGYKEAVKEYLSIREKLPQITLEAYFEIIKKHNAYLDMPKLNEYIKEKKAYIEWIDYNTPSPKNLTVTPLKGTVFGVRDDDNLDYDYFKSEWIKAYFFLCWELDILKNAKDYMSGLKKTDECKKDYWFWVNKQYSLLQPLKPKLNSHIYLLDCYSDSKYAEREISQDIIYVTLNIILAKSIIENTKLNNNSNIDLSILKDIMLNHHKVYEKGYNTMNELRVFKANYETSIQSLKEDYKE